MVQTGTTIISFFQSNWRVIVCNIMLLISAFLLTNMILIYIRTLKMKFPRKAGHELLYPDQFFNYIFKDADATNLIELRQGIVADFTVQEENNNAKSIVECIKELEIEYARYISQYFDNIKDVDTRRMESNNIKRQIVLLRKIISNEKDSFQTDNGNEIVNFNFNRQNYVTDLFLTIMAIPLFMEVILSQASSLEDLIGIIYNSDIFYLFFCLLVCISCYRLKKYFRNKYSMLTSVVHLVKYNKVQLTVDIFESAFNAVVSKDNNGIQSSEERRI